MKEAIAHAYHLLIPHKTAGRKGLTGTDFMQLLGMLCSEFSPQASDAILHRFKKQEHELVSLALFGNAVHVCLMYEDFLKQAETLFVSLEESNGRMLLLSSLIL